MSIVGVFIFVVAVSYLSPRSFYFFSLAKAAKCGAHRVSLATPMPVIAVDFARFKGKKTKRVLDGRASFLDT
jgi:hypothetical protein